MTQKRVLLPVKRFKQHTNECAIAATSSLGNYYDSDIEYEQVRRLIAARFRRTGMHTSAAGRLLNKLGFASVRIVTADQSLIDFSWCGLSKKALIKKLKEKRTHYGRAKNRSYKSYVSSVIRWLESDFDNELIIDWEFPKYIRKQLDKGIPIGAAINYTTLFRSTKVAASIKGQRRRKGDIAGEVEDHAIVLRGYDKSGVFVVDGDDNYDSQGYYKLSWETLLINIPDGDLIWVE